MRKKSKFKIIGSIGTFIIIIAIIIIASNINRNNISSKESLEEEIATTKNSKQGQINNSQVYIDVR